MERKKEVEVREVPPLLRAAGRGALAFGLPISLFGFGAGYLSGGLREAIRFGLPLSIHGAFLGAMLGPTARLILEGKERVEGERQGRRILLHPSQSAEYSLLQDLKRSFPYMFNPFIGHYYLYRGVEGRVEGKELEKMSEAFLAGYEHALRSFGLIAEQN